GGRLGRLRNAGGYAVSDLVLRPIDRTLARHAAEWGLAPDDGMSPLLQVAQCPASLDFPREDLPGAFRYGAPWRSAEPALDPPGSDGRPLIFCSLGTLQGSRKALFASMTQACAMIGARAVVAHGGGLSDADAAALPGDPLVRAFWPQTSLLPHCRAAILHGGFNTVLDTLAAGLPIVAVPIAFEQPATAARLERIGAGVVVRWQGATARRLATALQRVLGDPAYAAAAALVRDDLRRDAGASGTAAAISAAFAGALPPVA
ncbi:MAG TPA: nucleotide disphospho-sugar-binding domain-containing protein, partial [Sphingomonas sp.]|nr:nucleotide disphospho-sugar-binding domain-containing protein [Sphingomonas sp.]